MSAMRVLVTGEHGFTGRHLMPVLAQAGIDAIGLSSAGNAPANASGAKADTRRVDLLDAAAVASAVATITPTHVIHLAGVSFVAHGDVNDIYQINTLGTLHLLQALAASPEPPQRTILASTCNVYGRVNGRAHENLPARPVNHYGASKLAMEAIAGAFAGQLDCLVVRPFNYTGPGQHPRFLVPKLVRAFAHREPMLSLGNLDVERDFMDVRDVARAYVRLLDATMPQDRVLNLCSGQGLWLREIVEKLSALTGHVPHIETNPEFVRADEIVSLVGEPSRMVAALDGGDPSNVEFDVTLADMLAFASRHSEEQVS